MRCLHPILLQNDTPELFRKFKGQYREVPCGRCEACIDNRRKEWLVRLKEEAECSYNSHFVTLTYADEYLPRNSLGFPTFNKRDVQLWLKRLRKELDKAQDDELFKLHLRYFIIGEYGSKRGRPHYHCLMFNIPDVDFYKLVYKTWPYGRISCDKINQARIGYCANYMYGKCEQNADEFIDETNKLPMLSSRRPGIGSGYLNQLIVDWHKDGYKNFYQDGKIKYPLPRFYKDKIFDDDDKATIYYRNQKRLKEERMKEILKLHDFYQKYGYDVESPGEMERKEFLRRFYLKVKNHRQNKFNYEHI